MPRPTGPQFSYVPPSGKRTEHLVTALIDGVHVGSLLWTPEGEISDVYVPTPFRRRGIATGMYRYAQEKTKTGEIDAYSPEHASGRTPEGDAWARSTGDPLPPNEY